MAYSYVCADGPDLSPNSRSSFPGQASIPTAIEWNKVLGVIAYLPPTSDASTIDFQLHHVCLHVRDPEDHCISTSIS